MTSFAAAGDRTRSAVGRGAAFLGFWLILSGVDFSDLPVGIAASAAATWASLRLLPPGGARPSLMALASLALRFVRQSVVAGADVAWRALDPRLPLRPGMIVYHARLPPGPLQSAFCTLTSLLPGTLPAGPDDSGAIVIHCLDIGQPVAAQLADEERVFVRAMGGGRDGA